MPNVATRSRRRARAEHNAKENGIHDFFESYVDFVDDMESTVDAYSMYDRYSKHVFSLGKIPLDRQSFDARAQQACWTARVQGDRGLERLPTGEVQPRTPASRRVYQYRGVVLRRLPRMDYVGEVTVRPATPPTRRIKDRVNWADIVEDEQDTQYIPQKAVGRDFQQ